MPKSVMVNGQGFDAIPADVRANILKNYRGDVVLLDVPYYSTTRFQGVRAAGPPVTFTIDTTSRVAFGYGIGSPMTGAGFLAAFGNATQAETNLLVGSQTRDQADVWLYGMSCHATPDSEAAIVQQLWRDSFITISLNGTMNIPLGRLEHYPAGGGLYGAGASAVREPDLATPGSGVQNGAGAILPFFQNGNPMSGNFKRFCLPMLWAGVGAGADSALQVAITPARSIVITSGLARVAVAGVSAYSPPAAAGDRGSYADVVVSLRCISVQKRSQNT